MSLITWECPRCVQELTTILGPQNRIQGSCETFCNTLYISMNQQFARWCSSVPIVKRPTQKSSYVHISYVGASKEMKIVENYEMKLVFLTSPP